MPDKNSAHSKSNIPKIVFKIELYNVLLSQNCAKLGIMPNALITIMKFIDNKAYQIFN